MGPRSVALGLMFALIVGACSTDTDPGPDESATPDGPTSESGPPGSDPATGPDPMAEPEGELDGTAPAPTSPASGGATSTAQPTSSTTPEPTQAAPSGLLAWVTDFPSGTLRVGTVGDGLGRDLASDVAEFAWRPGGSEIAVLRRPFLDDPVTGPSISIVDVATGSETELSRLSGGLSASGLVWSPDGARLAFSQTTSPYYGCEAGIHTLDVASGTVRRLTVGGCDIEPDWSPDGSRLVFVRLVDTGGPLWTVAADGTDARLITPADDSVSGPQTRARDPRWGPGGRDIAFRGNYSGDSGLFLVRAGGGVPAPVEIVIHRSVSGLAWSPDGATLAFLVSDFDDQTQELATIAPDGTTRGSLAVEPFIAADLSWSPDGNWIAKGRPDPGSSSCDELGVYPLTGAALVGGFGCRPAFAPE